MSDVRCQMAELTALTSRHLARKAVKGFLY